MQGEVVYPSRHVPLSREGGATWLHAVELLSCAALGQRILVTGPPGSGKTTLLREIALSFHAHVSGLTTTVVAIDQRAEELAEWRHEIPHASFRGTSSDVGPEEHASLDSAFDDAASASVQGRNVLLVIDSLATLARAYNAIHDDSDRVLTGGLLASALVETRKRFGLGRAFAEGGSLTVVASASVDTDNELDDVVYHDLVGTGNMDIVLTQRAYDAALFPPLDLSRSGARHEEEILGEHEANRRAALRSHLVEMGDTAGLAALLAQLQRTGSLERVLHGAGVPQALPDELSH